MNDLERDYQMAVQAIDASPDSYDVKRRALKELDQWKMQQMKGQIATELSGPRFEPLETAIGTLPVTGATYNAKLGQYIPAYTETPQESAFKNRGQLLAELNQTAGLIPVPNELAKTEELVSVNRPATMTDILSSGLGYNKAGQPVLNMGYYFDKDGNPIKDTWKEYDASGNEIEKSAIRPRQAPIDPATYRRLVEGAAELRGEESPWVAAERQARAIEENKRALEQFEQTTRPIDLMPVFQPQARVDTTGRFIAPSPTDYVVNRAPINDVPDALSISRTVEQPFVNNNDAAVRAAQEAAALLRARENAAADRETIQSGLVAGLEGMAQDPIGALTAYYQGLGQSFGAIAPKVAQANQFAGPLGIVNAVNALPESARRKGSEIARTILGSKVTAGEEQKYQVERLIEQAARSAPAEVARDKDALKKWLVDKGFPLETVKDL